MKKYVVTFVLLLSFLFIPLVTSANSNDLKTPDTLKNYAFVNGGTYYINNALINNVSGVYKVGGNMKNYKLFAKGDFLHIQAYKGTLLVYDLNKDRIVQYALDRKILKEFPNLDTPQFLVHNNLLYYYNYNNNSLYEMNLETGKSKFLYSAGKSYIQEFTIHNGWLYFVHEFHYDLTSEKTEQFLSKFQLSNPKKVTKVIKNVYNIDNVVVRDGYIYAVIHKKKTYTNYNRYIYRMNYNGQQQKRITKHDTNTSFAVSKKHIYYVHNTNDFRLNFYRITIDGKNAKRLAKLPGIPVTFTSYKDKLYFDLITEKGNFLLHRVKAN